MKKADTNKNLQLIRCWNDILQWVAENCKTVKTTVPMEEGKLKVARGEAVILCTDGDVNCRIQKKSWHQGLTRKALTSIIRTQEKPFILLEQLVTGWETYKQQLIQENEKINKIYNFKA